jgi:Prophage minor tail protein Z (GPZ)
MADLIRLRFDSGPMRAALGAVSDQLPTATARAMNRTATTVTAFLARGMSRDLGLKVTTVKAAIQVGRATAARQELQIAVSGARLPLIAFKAKGPEPSRGRGRGVTAVIQGQRKTYPSAFIATMPTGHRGVYARKGRARLPIHELRGVSLPHVFDRLSPEALTLWESEYLKNLTHEVNYMLRRAAA